MIYILYWLLWVTFGWCICYKMDDSKLFIKWLNDDPTGFVNVILMTVWPVFALLIYRNKKKKDTQP